MYPIVTVPYLMQIYSRTRSKTVIQVNGITRFRLNFFLLFSSFIFPIQGATYKRVFIESVFTFRQNVIMPATPKRTNSRFGRRQEIVCR